MAHGPENMCKVPFGVVFQSGTTGLQNLSQTLSAFLLPVPHQFSLNQCIYSSVLLTHRLLLSRLNRRSRIRGFSFSPLLNGFCALRISLI